MRVVVVGGAGYIGSHVVRCLLDAGHAVTVFDNLVHGLRVNLFEEVSFLHGDIMHPRDLDAAFAPDGVPADAVIHLAAAKAAGESMVVPEKYAEQNIGGTINILNAMSRAGVSAIVFSSSAAVYGEPEYLPVDEAHPTNPTNFYGFTKLEIERLLTWYNKLKGIRFAALRYFNAAGYDAEGRVPGLEQNPANLLPIVMEVASGVRPELEIYGNDYDTPDGTCIRDYIHVSDLAAAHLLALEYVKNHGESLTVNLGSGIGVSVTEMVEAARRITGAAIPAQVVARRPGDPARLVASGATAEKLLGWSAASSSTDNLVETSWKVYAG